MSRISDFLQRRLAAGAWNLGQVLVRPDFTLRHAADADRSGLTIFTRPEDARELAKYDAAGNYRPLKTAPNLRRGWLLELSGLDELRLALDFLYPAAIGTWLAWERGELPAVSLRETLGRQSGMYRVARHITDEQAAAMVRATCVEGCIRHRLWGISARAAGDRLPVTTSAVLCPEACNLLVAACRSAVKTNPASV